MQSFYPLIIRVIIGRKLYICRQRASGRYWLRKTGFADGRLNVAQDPRRRSGASQFRLCANTGGGQANAAEISEERGEGLGAAELARALQCHHPELQLRPETSERGGYSPRRATQHRARLLGRAPGVGG